MRVKIDGCYLLPVTSLIAILLISAGPACSESPPRESRNVPRSDYADTIRFLEHRIHNAIKKHHLPSMAAALIDDQDIVWADAIGLANIEKTTPASADTVYRQWSLAKVLTAIETMRLVEEGLVHLDSPITDYLPEFKIQSPFVNDNPITIRSILAHRSGLPRNGNLPDSHLETAVLDMLRDQVMSLADSDVAFPVGQRFKYSNVGYDLLGHIIEEIRGQRFPLYMREHLLGPIGMQRSAFLSTQLPDGSEVAMGYEFFDGKHYPIHRGECTGFPSGNLYASLMDMAEFVKFIFRGGQSGSAQVINGATLGAMFENQFASLTEPQTNGLGWFTNQERFDEQLVWHHGGDSGTNALIAMLPQRKLGVVLFANELSFSAAYQLPIAADALELMLETKHGIVPESKTRHKPIKLDRSALRKYEGKYIMFGEVLEVYRRGKKLKGSIQGIQVDLVPIGEDRFRLTHWLMKIGLARFFPVDLREFELEFLNDVANENVNLVVHSGRVHSEFCPRCPVESDAPGPWEALHGQYEIVHRSLSPDANEEGLGHAEITVEDSLLRSPMGVLHPISPTRLVIVGGPFAGETVTYDPETHYLHHQGRTFKPVTVL